MNYSYINTALTCPYRVFEALRDALSIHSAAFADQTTMELSSGFLELYPPSRAGEPLSGFWDKFDPYCLGYGQLEWRDPNVQVTWLGEQAYLRGNRVCMERTLEILRHVCRDQLPLVIEWASVDHRGRPDLMVSKAARLTHDGVLVVSSAAIAASWRAEMVKPETTIRSQTINCPTVEGDKYIDIFLAENLDVGQCIDRYAAVLNAALRKTGLGHVDSSGDWVSSECGDEAADVCNEILVIASNISQALSVIKDVLIGAGCRVGCQLQYELGGKLLFETYQANGWSSPHVAGVIDNGRAYESEIWTGGVPA